MMGEHTAKVQFFQKSDTGFNVKKVVPESIESEVIADVLKLVSKHGLAISNIRDIYAKVVKHMLDNATIEED